MTQDGPTSASNVIEPRLEDPRTSRRSFVNAALAGAIAATFAQRTLAQATRAGAHAAATRQPAGELGFLVDRITNGLTPSAWARAEQLGYQGYLEEQLAYASIAEDPSLAATLSSFTTLTMTSKQLYDTYFAPGAPQSPSIPINELKTAAILRGAFSTRQLYERMVEFWTDHFNVDHSDGQVQWLKTTEDRDVIRANALGNFHDLLRGDARSAAMLFYLDNYRNFATAPNENYGREIMELHTLGVGNYTETDVVEVARCFTGWQYWSTSQPNHGDFRFNAAQHDNGSKTVLGHFIAAGGGVNDGETVLDILSAHPATAAFVARKMIRWLLCYEPPQAVVDQVAAVFLGTNGDIKQVIRTILAPATVIQVPAAVLPKIKRPFHLVASVLRTCSPSITQPTRYVNELLNMGHRPFSWPAPNGFPDDAAVWGSSVLARWTFLSRFFDGSIAGTTVPVATLFGSTPKSLLARKASDILSGGRLDAVDVAAVQAYADAVTTLNDTLRRDVLALSTQSPSFQYF